MAAILTRYAWAAAATIADPLTASIALSSGTGRKLIVCSVLEDATYNASGPARTVDGLTFDATSCTRFVNNVKSGAGTSQTWFYYDIPDGKAAATYDLVFDFSAGGDRHSWTAWVTSGDTAGEPAAIEAITTSGVSTVAASLNTVSGDVLLTVADNANSSVDFSGIASSQVTMGNRVTASGAGTRVGKADGIGDATESVTVTWTQSNTTDTRRMFLVNSTPAIVGPTITVQPVADVGIISNGQSTVYTATATGTNVQAPTWSEDASPIADGGIYDIVNVGAGTSECSSTLTITRAVKGDTPYAIKANFADDNGNTDTATVDDVWWTGPTSTVYAPTDGSGETTCTFECDFITADNPGTAIEQRIPLADGDVAITLTTTAT